MFIFGHLGITLGISFVLFHVILPKAGIKLKISYLFIALGAILPDLLDKPIGWILLNESVANGRLFGHTLLFAGIIALVGFHVKEHRTELFCVAFGVFMHLLEDLMWETPTTLLYPLFGFGFPQGSIGDWHGYFLDMVIRIYTPAFSYAFVTEVIGITILIGFAGFVLYTTLNVKEKKEKLSTKTNLKNSR